MSGAPERETSPLEERLVALIRSRGAITVADYMADALYHPHDGYYTTQKPIGADGDFTTAPEISQVFGEIIGLWLVQSWIDMGAPKEFQLIELGPGRGVLMQDALRAARLRPAFLEAAHVRLVETSGRLRHEQRKRLSSLAPRLDWIDVLEDAPEGPALVIANEFFDCLPIRQFVRTGTSWRERLVDIDKDGAALAFRLADAPPPPDVPLPDRQGGAPSAKDADIFEYGAAGVALAETIARRLVAHPGRALIIDYGHARGGLGDTLQAVRRHAYWPVLAAPGRADITAHVDFERLSRAAFLAGAAAYGPVAQGAFLERLGLGVRVERLTHGRTEAEADAIRLGAHRIAAPSAMGALFKALCIASPGLPTPPGFE